MGFDLGGGAGGHQCPENGAIIKLFKISPHHGFGAMSVRGVRCVCWRRHNFFSAAAVSSKLCVYRKSIPTKRPSNMDVSMLAQIGFAVEALSHVNRNALIRPDLLSPIWVVGSLETIRRLGESKSFTSINLLDLIP